MGEKIMEHRVDGLLAIAAYIGRSRHTLMRYLKQQPGDERPPVYKVGGNYHAYTSELNEWMRRIKA